MNGMVIYDSAYGNTRQVAETISGTLQESGIQADAVYIKDIRKLDARDQDFLVIGSPTKWGSMSFTTRNFLNKIKSREWAGKPFAAFDTENPENIERQEGSAAEKIAEKLKEKRMTQALPVLKAVVFGMKGPLQQGEIERIRDYARQFETALCR